MPNEQTDEERVRACWAKIEQALGAHGCVLDAVVVVTTAGVARSEIRILTNSDEGRADGPSRV